MPVTSDVGQALRSFRSARDAESLRDIIAMDTPTENTNPSTLMTELMLS